MFVIFSLVWRFDVVSDIARGGVSDLTPPDISWLQLPPITTGWGSRATYSEPSSFSQDPRHWSSVVQSGWGEGRFLLCALQAFLVSSHYLVSWGVGLMRSLPVKAFALVKGFPLGCKGPRESLVIPLTSDPSPTPSFMDPPRVMIAVFTGGSKVLSYPMNE